MTKISGFLPQSDVILDGITVKEHFYFMVSSKVKICAEYYVKMIFKFPQIEFKLSKLSTYQKQCLIQKSLRKFGLSANTKLKNLSGGEKRRLSLATEVKLKTFLFVIPTLTEFSHFSFLQNHNFFSLMNVRVV